MAKRTKPPAQTPGSPAPPADPGPRPELPPTGAVAHFAVEQTFSGPMPPPALLRQYNDILPGAAERMLALVERQQAHRHALETKLVDSDVRRTHLGMWMGLAVALASLGVAVFLAWQDKLTTNGLLAGLPLGALALGLTQLATPLLRRKPHDPRAVPGPR